MTFRKLAGWGVAQMYRLTGARRRAVARVREPGTILPIVLHAADADETRAILRWLEKAGILPNVELTFDDGWMEFRETIGVLEEFGVKATLFIAPGETARGRVWTDGLAVPERQALYSKGESERVAESERLTRVKGRRLMSEADVREAAKHPLVTLGNHTWSHLSCPHRPEEEVLAEVDRAQEVLTEWADGKAPRDFAYPFGRGTPRLDAAIRARGMTPWYTRQGFVTGETRGTSRNMVYEGMSLAENIGRILTAWPKVGETL